MGSWMEVRRSTPAENVSGVPDEATVYACWNTTDGRWESVTVYQGVDGECYVRHISEGDTSIEASAVDETEALQVAEDFRGGTDA